MTIRINSRFTFKSSDFKALSWKQFYEYIKNQKIDTNNDVWADLIDALDDGTLLQWLKRQDENIAGDIKHKYETPEIKTDNDKLKILVSGLLERTTENPQAKADKLVEEEAKILSKDKLEVGKNWIVQLSDNITLEMIWVSPGSFDMVSVDEDSSDFEKPVHQVNITQGYWIGKYQLTQEQWMAVGGKRERRNRFDGGRLPVECVSWYEARDFCEALNKKLKEKRGKYCFDLPTEAQWEFAALGGEKNAKEHRYKYSGSDDLDEVGWYDDNSNDQTHEVGKMKANDLGIYDMSGNVWEWCRDCAKWDDKEKKFVTDTYVVKEGGLDDPCCKVGSDRVIRGGSWGDTAGCCRPSFRIYYDPTLRSNFIGFRVALVPVQ